jgi:uncharacterized protein YkwD
VNMTLFLSLVSVWLFLAVIIMNDIMKELVYADMNRLEEEIIDATNHVRAANGLSILDKDHELASNAERYAMINAERGRISHDHEPLPSRMPPHCISIGENLYQGRGYAKDIVNAWLNSPSHRENILDPEWDSIGIGIARSSNQIIVVQLFCSSK